MRKFARALITLGILALAVAPAPAHADDPFTTGYVWGSQPFIPISNCYTPDPWYSYNSRDLNNTICHVATGRYDVRFPGLASVGGNVQVTAYGSTPANCKVIRWRSSGSDKIVEVLCMNLAGSQMDTYFTASYTTGAGTGYRLAFAWANNPTAAFYHPDYSYQFIFGSTEPIEITRASTGKYTVRFWNPYGSDTPGGSVKVTAYGNTNGVCKVAGWRPHQKNNSDLVDVHCRNSAGADSDEQFSVVFMNRVNWLGNNSLARGYALADQPSSSSYTPALPFQYSCNQATCRMVTITSPAVGTYDVLLPPHQDSGLDGGQVQATAFGPTADRCQVGSWRNIPGSGRSVRIYCFTNTGTPTDTLFTIQYTGKQVLV